MAFIGKKFESAYKTNIAFDNRATVICAILLLAPALSLPLMIWFNAPKNWRAPGVLALALNPLFAYLTLSQILHGRRTTRLVTVAVMSTLGTLLSWFTVFACAKGVFGHW